jgi:hypothetical protein
MFVGFSFSFRRKCFQFFFRPKFNPGRCQERTTPTSCYRPHLCDGRGQLVRLVQTGCLKSVGGDGHQFKKIGANAVTFSVSTQTMHIRPIIHISIAMFSLKTLERFLLFHFLRTDDGFGLYLFLHSSKSPRTH